MTDKTRWLGLGPWHEDNESELIDWTAQPQYKGLVKGDYYHAELRYSGRWGDPGHKGELDVVFDDDGKIAFAEFNETTMGNYYVRHFQNVSKRRTEFQFFQDFHDKRRSVAYGRVLANGFKYVEDQILEKQDLDADYDLLTGASFSMKNMIGLKNDVSAQRKDSNHKKQRYYGYTEDYGYGITGWLQVVVEDGKIVKATSNNTDYMNEILDIDEGARYIGEFAFGVNPEINHPIGDILFDEKIAGSFHLTPGNSYDNASNGNHSAVHWDLIQIQTPEFGGGEIWFDDVLIRKDGLFVLEELKCLNPENLL